MDPVLINIDFTKLGVSILRLWCGAHVIHQPNADNLVALTEGLIASMSTYRDECKGECVKDPPAAKCNLNTSEVEERMAGRDY